MTQGHGSVRADTARFSRMPAAHERAQPNEPNPALSQCLALLIAISILAPALLSGLGVNVRLTVILLGAVGVVVEVSSGALDRLYAGMILAAIVPYFVLMTLLCTRFHLGSPNSFDLERCAIILPEYILLGALLARQDRYVKHLRCFVYVGSVVALLAIGEYAAGHSLVGRESALLHYGRGGSVQVRALVFSEQPLVLGTLMAFLMPLVVLLQSRAKYIVLGLFLLAAYATGSRGPLVVGVIFTVVLFVALWTRALPTAVRVTRYIFNATIPIGAVIIGVFARPSVSGLTSQAYSANYRLALYSALPRILYVRPLGYGLGGLRPGGYLIQTGLFGVRDLSATVDSEIVLAAGTFGIIGIAAYFASGWFLARVLDRSLSVSLAGLIIWTSGIFVALHAWDSLGPVWYLLTGVALGLTHLSKSKREGEGYRD